MILLTRFLAKSPPKPAARQNPSLPPRFVYHAELQDGDANGGG